MLCQKSSVGDPDPGFRIGCFFDPWIRDGRKSASGSGIRNEQPGSYFLELKNLFFALFGVKKLKFFDEDPGSGMETVRIRDPGWKKVGSGIQDKHPESATLQKSSSPKRVLFYPITYGTVGTFRSIFVDKGKENVTKQFQSWGFSIFLLVDGRIPTEPDPYR